MQAGVEIVDERRSQLRSTSGETNVLPRVSREEQKKKKKAGRSREIFAPRQKDGFCVYSTRKKKAKKERRKLLQPAKGESLSRLF